MKGRRGFTVIEILVAVAIIALLAGIVFTSLGGARGKARDAKRKAEISQMGRVLSAGCYMPEGGPGTYDLAVIFPELMAKYPQLAEWVRESPRDPSGSPSETRYRYVVNAETRCALYANLETEDIEPTLSLSEPTAGGGTGILRAAVSGWNGTPFYFQVSN